MNSEWIADFCWNTIKDYFAIKGFSSLRISTIVSIYLLGFLHRFLMITCYHAGFSYLLCCSYENFTSFCIFNFWIGEVLSL